MRTFSIVSQPVNTVTIWDQIVPNRSAATISVRSRLAEFDVPAPRSELIGKNATLRVHYDVMPVVGLLQKFELTSQSFVLTDRAPTSV